MEIKVIVPRLTGSRANGEKKSGTGNGGSDALSPQCVIRRDRQ